MMPHQPMRGGLQELLSARALAFYVILAVIAAIIAYYLYNYLSTPIVNFEKYGYTVLHAIPVTNYKESFFDAAKGRSATIEIGLPANVALEEIEGTVVKTLEDLHRRRPDVDVITVIPYYSYNFGQPLYFSLGTATWGPNGMDTPVVHSRNKRNYTLVFRWTTKPWTIDERSLAESKGQTVQKPEH